MWHSIVNNSKREFHLKYKHVNSDYIFYVTNRVQIWEKLFSTHDLMNLLSECNPLLEGNGSHFISQCLDALFNAISQKTAEAAITFLNNQDNELELSVKVINEKFPLRIKLTCALSTPKKFYEEVTSSLFHIIKELKESESNLIESIKKKDAEIQDYKAEGACLSLKHLETKLFNQEEHQQMFTPSNNFYFDSEHFFNTSSAVKEESTPKHPILTNSPKVSSIKKTEKMDTSISTTSSPIVQTGVAPIISVNIKDESEENAFTLDKRKRKRLNF